MALPGRGSSDGGVVVRLQIDDALAQEELKRFRRDANRQLRQGLIKAGERDALPAAKRFAGRLRIGPPGKKVRTASVLVVRATTRYAYLTGLAGAWRLNRAVGLQEYGGTQKMPILPKKAKAVMTPEGPRANVTSPRVHHGRRFMTLGVESVRSQIDRTVLEEVIATFHKMPDA